MLTIDRREAGEAQEHHNTSLEERFRSLPARVEELEAADFAFLNVDNEGVGIERCEIGNFIQKLRSGELEEQLRKCESVYTLVYLLLEGVYNSVGGLLAVYKPTDKGYFRIMVYPNTPYKTIGASLIRLGDMGLRLIHSANFPCSLDLVEAVYKQQTKPQEEHRLFQHIRPIKIPVRMSADTAIPKLLALCPRMSEKVAIRLIHTYSNIWTILNTPDELLLQIEGLGPGILQRLKESIGKE